MTLASISEVAWHSALPLCLFLSDWHSVSLPYYFRNLSVVFLYRVAYVIGRIMVECVELW